MRCPNCDFDNPVGMKFCGNCGSRLPVNSLAPQDERKVVTVLFGDVSGFTAMSERLDPEDVKEIMNTCLSELAEIVRQDFDGTVDKFGGDSILAYFGAPRAHEDDPERAVRAALAMQDRMAEFSAQQEQRGYPPLRMRIGINTGLVLAGQMGSQTSHQESTIMGDAVNTASRLQTIARPGHIAVSESTHRLTIHSFEFSAVQEVMVKGKAEPVRTYEVIGIRSERSSIRGLESRGLSAPLIGRAAEMQELHNTYAHMVAAHSPILATIWGSAGSGKSRLIAEFFAALGQLDQPPTILRGRCLPFGQGSITYWPLGEMAKQECGISDSDNLAQVEFKLNSRLEALLQEVEGSVRRSEVSRLAAHIAATVDWKFAATTLAGLSDASRREERAWAWRRFFSLIAATRPLVLFFEDIHWADTPLLDFIEEMVSRADGAAIAIICASRPELRERHADWGSSCEGISVDLRPLTEEESAQLVNSLLVVDELPDSVRNLIVQRAEGNPFYLEEVIRLLMDEHKIERRNGRWVAVAGIEQGVLIPDNVQYILSARIDRLVPEIQKRVLQDAAVVGHEFWRGAISTLMEDQASADVVVASLHGLVEREMVVPASSSSFAGEDEYSFRHVLTHDVAYEMLPHRDRSQKHRRAAEWLERAAGDRLEEYIERIAYHYEQAVHFGAIAAALPGYEDTLDEMRAKAYHYLKLAGDKSMRLQDFLKARQFYDNTSAVIPVHSMRKELTLNLLISRANADFFLGDYDEAEKRLLQAIGETELLDDKSLLTEVVRQLGEVNRQKGSYEEATNLYNRLRTLCREAGDQSGEAYALSRLALSSLHQHPAQADAFARRAYEIANSSGNLAVQIQAMQVLIVIYSSVHGDLQAAQQTSLQLLELLTESGDRLQMSHTLTNLALVCYYLNKFQDSVTFSQQAIEKASELGYKIVNMQASNVLGQSLLALNQPEEAMSHLLSALEISASLDEREVLPEIRRGLAEAHLAMNEFDEALTQAEIATTVVLPEDVYSQATTQRTLGLALSAHGRSDEAEAAFRRSLSLLEDTAYLPVLAATCEAYAAFLEAQGRIAEADSLHTRAVTLRQRISAPQADVDDAAALLNITSISDSGYTTEV